MTAFAIFASFEIAARRAGARGFVGTLRFLPWKDPVFAGPALGMILFIFGGFGGVVNSSYAMDVLVHNTMWIVGHFHITVGGPVALTFIGVAYRIIPLLAKRQLYAPRLALASVYTWFIGMAVMSLSMHWAGLLGAPRRASDVTYLGAQGAMSWHPQMVGAAVGGSIVALGVFLFIIVATGTYFNEAKVTTVAGLAFAPVDEHAGPTPVILDRLGQWATIAIVVAVLAYAGPIVQQLTIHSYLAPGMRTW
jgi:cytochrome c oxidase subunit 1